MEGSAQRRVVPDTPGWGDDVLQAVVRAADICTAAVTSLSLRPGARCGPAMAVAGEAVLALRELAQVMHSRAFDEAVVEAERACAAVEALVAAGAVPQQFPRLHAV